MNRPPPRSSLLPYTPLFRSVFNDDGKRADRFQHAADLAGGGDVAVSTDLGATAHQGVRIDHGAIVDVSADIDVHRRHAGDVPADVCAFAHATAAGHHADVLLRADPLHGISVLVAEAEGAHRHIDVDAHPEADQNALLDPGVDAPARSRSGVRLGGADAAGGQRNEELREQVAIVCLVSGRLLLEEACDE